MSNESLASQGSTETEGSAAPIGPVLEVENLRVRYGSEEVVRGVSLTVFPGEIVALVGESGSGKSTTAAAILGLLPANAHMQADAIRVGGVETQQLDEPGLRAIRGTVMAYVPQDPAGSLDPVQRVRTQVEEVLRIHNIASRTERPARVEAMLREAGITDPRRIGASFPHELSGGLQQRALIAQAFAGGPQLIVADEPTSALDVTVQKEVLDNLAAATSSHNVAVLLITHDLAMASERADRVLVLRGGRIIEEGSAQQVLGHPREAYTRSLVAATPAAITEVLRTHDRRKEQDIGGGSTAANPLLRVRDLMKTFRGGGRNLPRHIHAVNHVSFDVAAGHTLAIVGESGSGKTTTARIVSRLERADSGSVQIDGTEVTSFRGTKLRELRRSIQYVHQNPRSALNPRLSVADAIAEPLRAFRMGSSGTQQRRIAELLDMVALPQTLRDRSTAQLSGGQAQRVSIARALALDPRLVVLDEAVSALDVSVQEHILELLEQLREELHLTYIFVSHDLSVVARIASEVAVMRAGEMVEFGSALQVLDNPQHEYTQRLLAAVPGFALADSAHK